MKYIILLTRLKDRMALGKCTNRMGLCLWGNL